MVEKANAEKKQQLKALKKECAQMEKETAMRAREVVEEHARVQNEANEMMDLITELRAMEREVAALESKRQQKQRELEGDADFNTTSDFDPELRLPYEDMQRLAASYTQQARKLETATLAPLVAEADKNDRVLQDTTRRVAELRQQRARVEVIARESGVARERELARGLGKKEATAQWHRNILTVLERALGVSDFAVEPLVQHQASTQPQIAADVAHQKLWKLNYVVAGAAVEAVIEEDKNQVVSAKLTDPQNRVTPAVVERLVAESRDVEPSWFLIQLFSLLQ